MRSSRLILFSLSFIISLCSFTLGVTTYTSADIIDFAVKMEEASRPFQMPPRSRRASTLLELASMQQPSAHQAPVAQSFAPQARTAPFAVPEPANNTQPTAPQPGTGLQNRSLSTRVQEWLRQLRVNREQVSMQVQRPPQNLKSILKTGNGRPSNKKVRFGYVQTHMYTVPKTERRNARGRRDRRDSRYQNPSGPRSLVVPGPPSLVPPGPRIPVPSVLDTPMPSIPGIPVLSGLQIPPRPYIPVPSLLHTPIPSETGTSVLSGLQIPMPPRPNTPVPSVLHTPMSTRSGASYGLHVPIPLMSITPMPFGPNISMLPRPCTPMPARPCTPMPARPCTPMPARPRTPMPARSCTSMPTRPRTPMPARPRTPMPARPSTPMPLRPGSPIPPEWDLHSSDSDDNEWERPGPRGLNWRQQ